MGTGSGTGSGVLGFTVDGEPYVGLVQQVNGVTCTSDAVCTSHSYYVLSKYRQQLPTQLPCDRTVGGSCAEFNAVALTGYMMSAVLVSRDLNQTFSDISAGSQYHLEGGAKDFYGWIYTSEGKAVAH